MGVFKEYKAGVHRSDWLLDVDQIIYERLNLNQSSFVVIFCRLRHLDSLSKNGDRLSSASYRSLLSLNPRPLG